MNVLHISTTYSRGGAAHSLRLLHHALTAAGHGSKVLVGRPTAPEADVAVIPPMPWWGRISYHGLNLMGLNYVGIPTTSKIRKHPFFAWADVVHYHNLHGGFFNYLALPALTREKPSVWTLRDMWGLTGHCAHSFACERWRTGCGKCPHLKIDPPVRRDATRWEWRLKQSVYARSRLTVTAPSEWLTGLAKESILGRYPVLHIPNAVNSDLYRPADKAASRAVLGWPQDDKILLFAAESVHNPFKHFALLVAALEALPSMCKRRLHLAILGDADGIGETLAGIPCLRLGYVDDDDRMARYYAAADMFVYPTRADNQPRVLLEAMACGCPPITNAVGGVPELVNAQRGIVVGVGDAAAMSKAIESLLADARLCTKLGSAGRAYVEEEHGIQQHVERMLNVYHLAMQ